jgi:phospholipase/carboxylesterase
MNHGEGAERRMVEYAVAGEEHLGRGPVLVLLHGRGADEHDLLGLRPYLPADWATVAPRAPFPAEPWGYGGGWAWYRYEGEDRPEPTSFEVSLRSVATLLRDLEAERGVEHERVVLGGFSQGGTVSLGYALATAAGLLDDDAPRVRRVVNLSGFLADHPATPVTPQTVAGTRFFWGHGTADPSIPFSMAETGRAALYAADADLVSRDYPIGHWIEAGEMADVVGWVQEARQSA